MRKLALASLLLLVTVSAFGHAGEVHSYMGTVSSVSDNGSFMLKKTDGETILVEVSKSTKYVHADGQAAKPALLAAGTRVVVTIAEDGKTATSIKFPKPKK